MLIAGGPQEHDHICSSKGTGSKISISQRPEIAPTYFILQILALDVYRQNFPKCIHANPERYHGKGQLPMSYPVEEIYENIYIKIEIGPYSILKIKYT